MVFFFNKIVNWFKSLFMSRDEGVAHEYMPGVEGVLSAPLRGATWMIPLILFVFLVSTILWLWFSEVDIVSPARATLLPSSRIKLIQSKEVNVIEEILVKEGEEVEKNAPLVKFKSKDIGLTINALENQINDLKVKRLSWVSLDKFLKRGVRNYYKVNAKKLFKEGDITVGYEAKILQTKINTIIAERDYGVSRGEELLQVIKKTSLEFEKLESDVSYQEKKFERAKSLLERKAISKNEYDDIERLEIETKNNLAISQQELKRARIEYRSVEKERKSKKQERLLEAASQLGLFNEQIKQLENDLSLQREVAFERVLRSPIKGEVAEIGIHTVRGVVQSGEVLMKVIPDKSSLEAEAKVLNQDIGFVSLGQKVNTKIDSFSFTKYGYISGKVIKIAESSELDEQMGPIFPVIVELDQNYLKVDGRKVYLKPGMTAVVDIKIGRRRLAEYIISPLLRYRDEALRER